MGLGNRLKNAWNTFLNKDPTNEMKLSVNGYSRRPDRPILTRGNERTIITAIYNRIALDVSAIDIMHVRLDENGRMIDTIDSGLNNILTISANIDQTSRAFMQDIVLSMLDEGCVAVVPIDVNVNPRNTESYDIQTMRTGKILEWYPNAVKVRVYNDRTGNREDVVINKDKIAIIENPFYTVMNERNSTLQRLVRKLTLLDTIDNNSGMDKLNLIVQLPYVVKSDARKAQAEARRKDIEDQIANSKYGIAYTDGTEHITQLNRSVETDLMPQIEYLTKTLYGQLGISEEVMNGTASDAIMLNYFNRTIEPIISTIADEFKRKFLSKTARTQKQSILFFRDPFSLAPVNQIADIADKFTRNEIMSSNEIRQIVGLKPSDDPGAEELRNKNIAPSSEQSMYEEGYEDPSMYEEGYEDPSVTDDSAEGQNGYEDEEAPTMTLDDLWGMKISDLF